MFFVSVPPSIYPLNQKVEVRGGVDGGHNKKKPQAFEACGLVYNPLEGIIQE